MVNDGNAFKIVHNGYGSFSVYDCTLDNAQALLNRYLENLGFDIVEAAAAMRDKTRYVVNTGSVVAALTELLDAKMGQALPKVTRLIHGKPVAGDVVEAIVFDAGHMTQVMAWAQSNGVAWTNLKELVARAQRSLETMQPKSFFLLDGIYKRANGLQPLFLDADTLEVADELSILQGARWKDTAKESHVVQRYLRFISSYLTHRDETFDLGSYGGIGG